MSTHLPQIFVMIYIITMMKNYIAHKSRVSFWIEIRYVDLLGHEEHFKVNDEVILTFPTPVVLKAPSVVTFFLLYGEYMKKIAW